MNGKGPPSSDIAGIIGDAAGLEAIPGTQEKPDDLLQLAERVDLLVADFGRWESYKGASADMWPNLLLRYAGIGLFARRLRWPAERSCFF